MNLYRLPPSEAFLPKIADFIINNFEGRIDRLKVILPSFFACINLQKILIKKKKITILPNIIPFFDISVEGAEIFKTLPENIFSITYLEEKIILSEIIHNYKDLKFDINQSLKFSPLLAKLFYEFTYNNISIESIKDLPTLNQATHWQFIYEFLSYAYQNWQIKIKELKKQDRATHKINMIQSEIDKLNSDPSCLILVAGIVGDNILSWDFLKNVADSPCGFVILPPISNFTNLSMNNGDIPDGDTLYCIKQLLKILGRNLSDFKLLDSNISSDSCNILDQLITKDNSPYIPSKVPNIGYIELDDIYQEAEEVALICKENSNKLIAIVINNENTKEFYCNFLLKYFLEFQDLLGNDLSKINISNLIISISEILYSDFNIKKLFVLCKNPLLDQTLILSLERLLLGKNRLVSDISQVLSIVKETGDEHLIEWFENLVTLLYQDSNDITFNAILRTCIAKTEKLCPNIWSGNEAYEVSEYFAALIKFKWNFPLENKEDFPEILRSIMSGTRYFSNNINDTNIIIGKAEDLFLLKFDLVIMVDFSEGNFPQFPSNSPWFNNQMQDELKLYFDEIRCNNSLYNFYLLLHNDEIIITRSKKQNGNTKLIESSYMLKLKYILENSSNKILKRNRLINSNTSINIDPLPSFAQSTFFPDRISVTDIEMLIRNPYSFYAKKILNLKKCETIESDAKSSEFGIFIHDIIDQYSKAYNNITDDKLKYIIDISNNILNERLLSTTTKKVWSVKFSAIAPEFIQFDEERRNSGITIYSEAKGEMQINIAEKLLKITCIADRIEIDSKSNAIILDYKTGEVPSKNDVLSGKSPQLVIESLIALHGGFGIEIHYIPKIIYVKISSSKPYIKLIEIELTKDDLEFQKQALISLLEHYIINKQFSMDIDLLKYNDYKHLTRK